MPFQFKKNLKNLPFLKALDNDLNLITYPPPPSSSIVQYTLALEMMKYKLKGRHWLPVSKTHFDKKKKKLTWAFIMWSNKRPRGHITHKSNNTSNHYWSVIQSNLCYQIQNTYQYWRTCLENVFQFLYIRSSRIFFQIKKKFKAILNLLLCKPTKFNWNC